MHREWLCPNAENDSPGEEDTSSDIAEPGSGEFLIERLSPLCNAYGKQKKKYRTESISYTALLNQNNNILLLVMAATACFSGY